MDARHPPSDIRHSTSRLSPWPVRVLVWAVLVAVALGAIWLIDRRAQVTMQRMQQEQQTRIWEDKQTGRTVHAGPERVAFGGERMAGF